MRDDEQLKVLRDYPHAVLALRAAYRDRRLGLMLGAGITRSFAFGGKSPPDWSQLVDRLADSLKFDATQEAYARLSMTQKVDILFRHFASMRDADPEDDAVRARLTGEWRDRIRGFLYGAWSDGAELLRCHTYMRSLLELVLSSPLTVTYNFDSYLEESLDELAERKDLGMRDVYSRPYETITDIAVPQRGHGALIYHINGYLPRNRLDTPSEHLVFSEGEFASQLMTTMAGRYATIAHHLANSVYLLLGLSLDDPNLRHLLHTNSIASPGRVHFIVRYLKEPKARDELSATERSIAESGFDLHNLVTLYLTAAEINALCRLVAMEGYDFLELAKAAGVGARRVFYLSGIPGIGKTTTLRLLGGIEALDEWVEPPSSLLLKPHRDLSRDERKDLDMWIAEQFRLKNEVLSKRQEGVFLVERGPLDPLAFEDPRRRAKKAREYTRLVERNRKALVSGHLFLLHGDTRVVERRIARRQPNVQPADYLADLQAQIFEVYDQEGAGRSSWESTDWTVEELVKRVARRVYDDRYDEVDMHGILSGISGG